MHRSAWIVIASAAFVVAFSLGIRAAFGLFLKPISAELQLGREVFSLALAFSTLITGIGGPFAGALADRFGAMRVVIAGAVFSALGLFFAMQVQSGIGLQLTFGILLGVGSTAVSMGIAMGAVARAIPQEKRAQAFGIVMSAGSFGQFAMIPAAQAVLSEWDWRVASGILALCAALIIPIAFGLRPPAPGTAKPPAGAASLRLALAEATGHSGFWLLTTSFFVCGFHVSYVQTHLPAYLSDRGMTPAVAAQALAFIGLFNIFGSFAAGWLGTRYRNRYLLAGVYLLRAVIFLPLILLPMTPALAIAFSMLMGLLYLSTVVPTTTIVAQIFGPRYFSTLYGIVFGSHQLGGFLGSWLGGRVFDLTGSYDTMWWIAIGLALAAAALAAPLRDAPIHRPATA
ncbi:MAG: MFS transporter [Burkholderiales bacterium]